jgi:hypothetical protein
MSKAMLVRARICAISTSLVLTVFLAAYQMRRASAQTPPNCIPPQHLQRCLQVGSAGTGDQILRCLSTAQPNERGTRTYLLLLSIAMFRNNQIEAADAIESLLRQASAADNCPLTGSAVAQLERERNAAVRRPTTPVVAIGSSTQTCSQELSSRECFRSDAGVQVCITGTVTPNRDGGAVR